MLDYEEYGGLIESKKASETEQVNNSLKPVYDYVINSDIKEKSIVRYTIHIIISNFFTKKKINFAVIFVFVYLIE